jgi:hypothetical protein
VQVAIRQVGMVWIYGCWVSEDLHISKHSRIYTVCTVSGNGFGIDEGVAISDMQCANHASVAFQPTGCSVRCDACPMPYHSLDIVLSILYLYWPAAEAETSGKTRARTVKMVRENMAGGRAVY